MEQVQPTTFAERHKVARESRGVWVRDVEDGMTELLLRGPAVPVHGIHDMITH
ncbi:MAG: HNH endonuclease, partial [Microbacterium sp.]